MEGTSLSSLVSSMHELVSRGNSQEVLNLFRRSVVLLTPSDRSRVSGLITMMNSMRGAHSNETMLGAFILRFSVDFPLPDTSHFESSDGLDERIRKGKGEEALKYFVERENHWESSMGAIVKLVNGFRRRSHFTGRQIRTFSQSLSSSLSEGA